MDILEMIFKAREEELAIMDEKDKRFMSQDKANRTIFSRIKRQNKIKRRTKIKNDIDFRIYIVFRYENKDVQKSTQKIKSTLLKNMLLGSFRDTRRLPDPAKC